MDLGWILGVSGVDLEWSWLGSGFGFGSGLGLGSWLGSWLGCLRSPKTVAKIGVCH